MKGIARLSLWILALNCSIVVSFPFSRHCEVIYMNRAGTWYRTENIRETGK